MNARLTCIGMLLWGSVFLLSGSKNSCTMHTYNISNVLEHSKTPVSLLTTGNMASRGLVLDDMYSYYCKYHAAQMARTFTLHLHP